MSGFDRARLALVGDANEGARLRVDRFAGPSEVGGALEPPTRILEVGDVLRRFGAESIGYLGEFLLSYHVALDHATTYR